MEQVCCEIPPKVCDSVLTMSRLEAGSRGTVKNFMMNCEDASACRFVRRLKEVGLRNGANFEVLKNDGNGELSISCEGTTLALGRGMAEKVIVEVSSGAIMGKTVFSKFCQRFGIKCHA